jgi:hypothetical protein
MLVMTLAALGGGVRAEAQPGGMGGGMRGGMRGGMMGGMAGGDSTTAGIMRVVHALLDNHDKLRRTVTNLPNGVRTVTESDDATLARQLKEHVRATGAFVARGEDPNLPMMSPSLHGVLANGKAVVRLVEETPTGVIVTETSEDSATVALLQTHAAEITEQVKRGMEAVHESMMGTMMPSRMAPPPPSTGAPAAENAPGTPTRAGQEAFATIGEIVRLLQADTATDWSRVNIEALREHLRDMDDVTMRAEVRSEKLEHGARFTVVGTGRVTDAIRRMALAHGGTISSADGFTWRAREVEQGAEVTITVTDASNTALITRVQALGFIGLLTLGDHHTAHHLGIARGSMSAHAHHH